MQLTKGNPKSSVPEKLFHLRRPTKAGPGPLFPFKSGSVNFAEQQFRNGTEISFLAPFSAGFPISMCEGTCRRPIVGLRVREVVRIVGLRDVQAHSFEVRDGT
jgi:hypothetical protein